MRYSFLDLAKDALNYANIPLSVKKMWEIAGKQGLLEKLASSGCA